MADQKLVYVRSTLAVTSLNALVGGAFACSAEFDNSVNLYLDVKVGGTVVWGATLAAGDGVRIYIVAREGPAASDVTGGIGAGLTISDAVKSGANFTIANIPLLDQVAFGSANDAQHWGPWSVGDLFGYVPEYFGVFFENSATTNALAASGHALNTTAIYTTVT